MTAATLLIGGSLSADTKTDKKNGIPYRALGRTGLRVSQLGFGGAPLGNLFAALSDAAAGETVAAAFESGIRLFDTAPLYDPSGGRIRA